MKKAIFSFFVGSMVLSAAFVPQAHAQGVDINGLLAQIEALKAQIERLQVQVQGLRSNQAATPATPAVPATPAWCYKLNASLRLGDNGSGVEALQNGLQREGLYNGAVSGTFDQATHNGVVRFQEKYRQEILGPFGLFNGTGFVGRTTKAKLNGLYGCEIYEPPVHPNPAPTPNGNGEIPSGTPIPTPSPSNKAPVVQILDPELNNDGVVNSLDTEVISAAFLAKRGSAKYKQELDVNNSGLIDINDITLVTNSLGLSWPPVNLEVGKKLIFYVAFSDPDGDVITAYQAEMGMEGAIFDPSLRRFEWTPRDGQEGTHSVTFKGSDGKTVTSQTLSITVIAEQKGNNGLNGTNGSN